MRLVVVGVISIATVVTAGSVAYLIFRKNKSNSTTTTSSSSQQRSPNSPKRSAPVATSSQGGGAVPSADVFKLLMSVRCFSKLPLSTVMSLLSEMHEEVYPENTELIHIGDVGNECYLLVSGVVEVHNKANEYIVTIPEGSFFGEMALLNNTIRNANVVCVTEVRVLRLERDGLFKLLRDYPVMREAMQKEVIRRSVEERFTSQEKSKSDVQQRILSMVEEEFEEQARNAQEGGGINGTCSIRWRKGHKLGSGAYGVVYSAINLGTGETMAVKVTTVEQMRNTLLNSNKMLSPQKEAERLKALCHPYLLKVYGFEVDLDTGDSYIFMELMAGSLKSRLREFGPLPEALLCEYTAQMLLGLNYLHNQGILHRDIKPDNILVTAGGNIVKLADFGLSRDSLQFQTHGICGTPAYMSPESITGRYGVASDVWALGCTLLELLTGRPPWSELETENTTQLMYVVATTTSGPDIPDWAAISPVCLSFLTDTFTVDPKKRPDTSALMAHPWVAATLTNLQLQSQPQQSVTPTSTSNGSLPQITAGGVSSNPSSGQNSGSFPRAVTFLKDEEEYTTEE